MSWRNDRAVRRAYYAEHAAATISRRELGSERQRVEPPSDVERREFSAPCFRCGERGDCKHRHPESQSFAGITWITPIQAETPI